MRDEFQLPNFSADLDVEQFVRLVPAGATVKGMMLQSTLDHVIRAGQTPPDGFGPYIGFKDYRGQEFVRVLAASGERVAQGRGLGNGLRELGQIAYPTLRDTLIGRTMFSIFASDIRRILRLASKAYGVTASVGGAEVLEMQQDEAVVELTDIYSFLEYYHFGVMEGVLKACKLGGEVGYASGERPTSGRFWVRWSTSP